jgi:hypothetical protein
MNKRHLYILALFLTLIGLGLFAYKAFILKFPLIEDTSVLIWNLEVHITFNAGDEPIKVGIYIPRNTPEYAILDENFISQGYGLATTTPDEGNRRAIWSIRKANGKQSLYYRAVIRRMPTDHVPGEPKTAPLTKPTLESPLLEAAQALAKDILSKSADTESFVQALIKRINDPSSNETISVLTGHNPTLETKLNTVVEVLKASGLPARVIHGIRIPTEPRSVEWDMWFQVYDKNSWRSFDPLTGTPEISGDFVEWWHGTNPFNKSKGIKKVEYTVSVAPNQEEAIQAALLSTKLAIPKLFDFSLFNLPLQTQAVYRILLMVPLGALLLLILRNIIGIKTFGTFMPILIALAFRETQLLWGITLFSLVVSLGLGVRFYLEQLKLLLVPRLASLLIVVVLLMAFLSILSYQLGFDRGLSVALFPMVIITMTIERMCIVWEERGASESIQQGIGSLLVAILTYLAMSIPYIEHLLFVFPELLLVLLAGTLLMGRYSGFRLLELPRFKALVPS